MLFIKGLPFKLADCRGVDPLGKLCNLMFLNKQLLVLGAIIPLALKSY